jgi:uncharacterized protein (TIGR03382 family)
MNRTALATGSALAACSLASVAEAQATVYMTMTDFNQSVVAPGGTATDSGTFGTPVNTLFSNVNNGGTYSTLAFYSTGIFDSLYVEGSRTSAFSGGTLSGSATINFLTTVSVSSLLPATANATFVWQLDAVTLNVGNVFTAGTYTLSWSGSQDGTNSLFAGQIFFAGPGSAVPLPPAAAFAAAGLAGLGRRRRR